jgi:hypothetical protein
MNTTSTRKKKVVRTAILAAALAGSVAACTNVTPGTVVMADLGPCAGVGAPMVEIPTSGAEPQMRIPEPEGWERSAEVESVDGTIRFAIANSGNGPIHHTTAVMVERVPDAAPQTIFDDFETHLARMLGEEGMPTDLTTTAGTVCGLPSTTITYGAPAEQATNLLVVTESGGDTYLVAVVQTTVPGDAKYEHDAETILTGLEVLPQTETAA